MKVVQTGKCATGFRCRAFWFLFGFFFFCTLFASSLLERARARTVVQAGVSGGFGGRATEAAAWMVSYN